MCYIPPSMSLSFSSFSFYVRRHGLLSIYRKPGIEQDRCLPSQHGHGSKDLNNKQFTGDKCWGRAAGGGGGEQCQFAGRRVTFGLELMLGTQVRQRCSLCKGPGAGGCCGCHPTMRERREEDRAVTDDMEPCGAQRGLWMEAWDGPGWPRQIPAPWVTS